MILACRNTALTKAPQADFEVMENVVELIPEVGENDHGRFSAERGTSAPPSLLRHFTLGN